MATRILVSTGAESSGKTTLANQLAETLGAPLVTEMSRPYLESRGPGGQPYRYGPADLLAIARLQLEAEQSLLAAQPPLLVCDTDLLVILIWSEVRFGRCDPWIRDTLLAQQGTHLRHYLLCDCSIPWMPDPLRENPHDRERLFLLYREKLEYFGMAYSVVSGSREERVSQVVALVPELSA